MSQDRSTGAEAVSEEEPGWESVIADATVQAQLIALHGKDFAVEVGAVAAAEYALSTAVLRRSSGLALLMLVLALWSIGLLLLSLAYLVAVQIGAGWLVALVVVNCMAAAGVVAAVFCLRHYAGQAGFRRTRELVSRALAPSEERGAAAPEPQ